jgi:hypothetical protein
MKQNGHLSACFPYWKEGPSTAYFQINNTTYVKYLKIHAVNYTPTHMVKYVGGVRKYLQNICTICGPLMNCICHTNIRNINRRLQPVKVMKKIARVYTYHSNFNLDFQVC